MNLAFCLFKYFLYGGLQRDFMAIASECLTRGHQVDVFTLHWQGDIPVGMNVHILDVPGLTNHGRYQHFSKILQSFFENKSYDLVVGFNKIEGLDVYFAADPCYEEKVRHFRSGLYRLTGRYRCFSSFEKKIFSPQSDTDILALTQSQIADFKKHYGTQDLRFHLIPPWVKQDRRPPLKYEEIRRGLRQEFSVDKDEKLVLFLGSGFQVKGLDRAMHAISALAQEEQKKIHVVIVGHDNIKPFEKLAHSLSLYSAVHFLGGRKDIPRFLFGADLLLHPAYSESAGIVLLEATIAGLPVLTTAACGYAYHVIAANAGVVLPEPFQQAQLNKSLKELLFSESPFQSKGIVYGEKNNFYHMPKTIVDYLEKKEHERIFYTRGVVTLHKDLMKTWSSSFNDIMATQGEVFRQVDDRKTLKFIHQQNAYFLKLHFGVGWIEIIKNLFFLRLPVLGAINEKLAIEKLHEIGVETMTLAGYGEKGCNPAQKQSFIVTYALENTMSLEDYCKNWEVAPPLFTEKKLLLEKIAHITKTLHQNGINHRDYYICHFLLEKDQPLQNMSVENLKLFLIDLHRVQIRKNLPQRWRVKDLAGLLFSTFDLGLSQKDWLRFIKVYMDNDLRTLLQDPLWRQVHHKAVKLYQKAFQSSPRLPQGILL